MSSNPKQMQPQKPNWSLICSTAAAAATTTSTISKTSARAVPDVITPHSPLPLTFPPCGSLQVQASSLSSTSSSSSSFVAAVSSLVVPTDAAIADFATDKRDNPPHLPRETLMAAQDKVMIPDGMPISTFVELIREKFELDSTLANSNRDILVRDQYTNVGRIRLAMQNRDEWINYGEKKNFPDLFTRLAAKYLFSPPQQSGTI